MNFLKSVAPGLAASLSQLDGATFAKVSLLAIISLPVAMVYAFYKINKTPKEVPLTIEEQYPNEHLGI